MDRAGGMIRLTKNHVWCTVQGEGMLAGTPSVFLRLAGCNRRCTWCDTPKSLPDYDPVEKRFLPVQTQLGSSELAAEAVARQVSSMGISRGYGHFVLTGGEPMLQQDELAEVMRIVDDDYEKDRDRLNLPWDSPHFTIESNCEIAPDYEVTRYIDLASLSPKPEAWMDGSEARALIERAFREWKVSVDEVQLKIVVRDERTMRAAVHMFRSLDPENDLPWRAVQLEGSALRRGPSFWETSESGSSWIDTLAREQIRLVAQMHPVLRLR